jgi:hypothetical protein
MPADEKWVARASVSEVLALQIEGLSLKYTVLYEEQALAFRKASAELERGSSKMPESGGE